MCPKHIQGFSLISAIFLLVVVTLLGAYVVTLSTSQQTTEALDIEGARAYQAARAGVEWGAWQILQDPAGAFSTACNGAAYAAPTSQSLAGLAGTLSGFAVDVQCGSAATTEAGVNVRVYRLTVTASKGTLGSLFYVERQLQAVISR
ncbi:MAG TPA: agglutinin biogenesis protein MshP [Burkholderiales bacterium]|jgi:MSHA biogenesis protein MshP|nr:agglutinin biogenesis protein MshP [Burkholderiales bacterium]